MANPAIALMIMAGIGLGALFYYMFVEAHANESHQYQHGTGGHPPPPSEFCNPWGTSQDERRTRRRKRGSIASNSKSDCTICLGELAEKESIQLFPCKHEFHKICIIKWLQEGPQEARNTCPNCREGIWGSKK